MSDEAVLRLVGKLVSRATTLVFCTFPDSDRNIMKKAEQAEQRCRKRAPSGMDVAPDGMEVAPDGIDFAPSGIHCLGIKFEDPGKFYQQRVPSGMNLPRSK